MAAGPTRGSGATVGLGIYLPPISQQPYNPYSTLAVERPLPCGFPLTGYNGGDEARSPMGD